MSAEAIAIVGVGVALPAVLVPLILTLHGRVARIEGALTGPWRPTNGSPAAVPKGPSEATAE